MMHKKLIAGAFLFALSGIVAAAEFTAGKDYFETGAAVKPIGDTVEVTEYFGFWCPHCNNFEPILEKWVEKQDKDVNFNRVPVSFSSRNKNQVYAQKAYYIGKQLKSEKKIDSAMFDFYHKYGRISGLFKDIETIKTDPVACSLKVDQIVERFAAKQAIDKALVTKVLNDDVCNTDARGWGLLELSQKTRGNIQNDETLEKIFAAAGVKTDNFSKYTNSFSLKSELKAGNKKSDIMGIDSVPTIVVNGKYRVTSGNGFGRMLEVVEYLVEKERAEIKK